MAYDEIDQQTRLVIVDDQRSFAEALKLALGMTDDLRAVGLEQSADDGFALIEATKPDVIVTSYRLTGAVTGLDLAKRVRDTERSDGRPFVPVVVLTAFAAPAVIRRAREIPNVTVLSKRSAITEIVSGLRRAVDGGPSMCVVTEDPYSLSPAEMEVLEYLSAGLNASAIATELCLSVHAIRARIRGLLTKTDSSSQLEAVAKATRAGLVVPPPFDAPLAAGLSAN
jgi:DNA-binding NarL/FixJ family response regulator